MEEAAMGKIAVWALEDEQVAHALPGVGGRPGKAEALELIELEPGVLRDKLETFLKEFEEMAEQPDATFAIDEIELALTVNAKGAIALLAKLEGGAEAGIKVKIRRRATKQNDEGR